MRMDGGPRRPHPSSRAPWRGPRHDHHRLGDVGDHSEVVRDEDDADVELTLDAVDELRGSAPGR